MFNIIINITNIIFFSLLLILLIKLEKNIITIEKQP
jgi:hypothetical protein